MVMVSRKAGVLALGGTGLLALLLMPACGSRSTLYAFGGGSLQGGGDDGGETGDGGEPLDAGPDAPTEDAAQCMGKPIALTVNAPNLYFVLDHSTSMKEMNKWTNVRSVVSQLITQIGAGARFGATMYPGNPAIDACSTGTEVMSLQRGDAQGNLASIFLGATDSMPSGGTPTAATLNGLVAKLSGLPGGTFVILATDGGPNCNASIASCSVDRCTSNIDGVYPQCPAGDAGANCCDPATGASGVRGCLDETGAVDAAANLARAGVKVYVLGIPGSADYATILDEMAVAGGTARPTEPRYYATSTADDTALTTAFDQIVQATGAGCTFTLASAPTVDANMRVVLDGATVPTSGPNRWQLKGTTLTLLGTSCDAVKNVGMPSLELFDGCRG